MNESHLLPTAAGTRLTLALGLAVGAGLTLAVLGARPVSGHEEAEAAPNTDLAVHMHPPLGIRSVGELFPLR